MYDPPRDGVSIDNYADYTSARNRYESSGIYSKAVYLLNTMYGWSMEELFVIFSKANELYWTENIGFNDALCGLYEVLADIHKTNATKLISKNEQLAAAFNSVGLSCEQNQTVAICGDNLNTYCIYKDITPSNTTITEFIVQVNLESNLGSSYGINATIELAVHDNPCISPEISFEYEDIDLDNTPEWIDVYDAEMKLIERCGSEWKCGQWNTTCIKDRKLGIVSIAPNNAYPLTIKVSKNVNSLCFQHDYVIQSRIRFRCNLDTPQPTDPVPTASPITFAPTTPTIQPTMPTLNPTPGPTHVITNCSTNNTTRHCYFEDVYANSANQTITTVRIENVDENTFVYYDVNFTVLNADCIEPKLTFTYETVESFEFCM